MLIENDAADDIEKSEKHRIYHGLVWEEKGLEKIKANSQKKCVSFNDDIIYIKCRFHQKQMMQTIKQEMEMTKMCYKLIEDIEIVAY